MTSPPLTRRGLFAAGAAIGSAAALGVTAHSQTLRSSPSAEPSTPAAFPSAATGAPPPSFFSAEEFNFIDAAVERLIPADDLGPGARQAGVTTFIDRQLAGAFGKAETLYMQGPWPEGTPSQGYQSRLTPAQLYRAAIGAIESYCRKTFANKRFAELNPDDQDKVLSGLENGDIALDGVKSKNFFDALLANTIEGFFSDPIYGGNRVMAGWKLIGFPGARYDYRDYVSKHGEKFPLPPVGLKGRPGWNPHG